MNSRLLHKGNGWDQELKMDIYSNQDISIVKPCILFVFGGGFTTGRRDSILYQAYFNKFLLPFNFLLLI